MRGEIKQTMGIAGLLVLTLILAAGSFVFWQEKFQTASVVLPLKQSIEEESAGTLLFVGDIMLNRGVEWYIRQNGENWKWPFLRIADTLQKADLAFGNLESVISDKGENLGSIFSFRAKPESVEGLLFAGFDVLSVANNHSLDYGIEAFTDSMERMRHSGIATVGGGITKEGAHTPVMKDIKGTKIGFLGYTNLGSPLWQAGNAPGVAWVDQYTIGEFQDTIRTTKQQSDILIVSVHFGEEYQTQPSETQKLIAKSAIDAGADIVIGHHTHVVQPVEQYKKGWIAWSLGNFVFDQGFSPETMQGLVLEVVVQDKKITKVSPRSIYLNSEFQPSFQNLAQ